MRSSSGQDLLGLAAGGREQPDTRPNSLFELQVLWFQPGTFGNARQHPRADLLSIVESKDEIRPAGS